MFAIRDIASQLVHELDFGQLDAVARLLATESTRQKSRTKYEVEAQYLAEISRSIFRFRSSLGGDVLDRSQRLAETFVKRFPSSQLASVSLARWHNDFAWTSRGGGVASGVSEASRRVFLQHATHANEILKPILRDAKPSLGAIQLNSQLALATSRERSDVEREAEAIANGPYVDCAKLHSTVALYLLPRWHGDRGMAESYLANVADLIGGAKGDALYAEAVSELSEIPTNGTLCTLFLDLDADRIMNGTKEFYKEWCHPNVMDHSLIWMASRNESNKVRELLELRERLSLAPGSIASRDPRQFLAIEKRFK